LIFSLFLPNRRGELSDLGKTELRDLASRLASRLPSLFAEVKMKDSNNRIQVISSGKSRTAASLNAFVHGLPDAMAALIDHEPPNSSLLYFHDNGPYQMFYKKDKNLKNKLRSIQMQPYSKTMARQLLERIYRPWFVDKLEDEDYSIVDHESGKVIRNEMDAVRMLHGLYLIGSNLREEGVGTLLEKYFEQDESAWFAYLNDAKVSR
jgi:hypothetical protein